MAFRRAAHVAWRQVGDDTVLVHLKKKRVYVLNSSAGYFWNRLDGSLGARQFLDDLSLDQPIPEEAGESLDRFLDALSQADLLAEGGTTESNEDEDEDEDEAPTAKASPYPFDAFVAPELVWQEDMHKFGASCAFLPAQMGPCASAPSM